MTVFLSQIICVGVIPWQTILSTFRIFLHVTFKMFVFSKTLWRVFTNSFCSHFRWRRGRIADTLGVPLKAVYVRCSRYNPNIRNNYVTVNFHDNQCLQVKEIISTNVSRVRLDYFCCILYDSGIPKNHISIRFIDLVFACE